MKTRSILLLVILALGAGFVVWRFVPKKPASAGGGSAAASGGARGGSGKGGGGGGAGRPVAVVATTVGNSDVPIWLLGLGSVQAYNSVTIRPRVSGTLEQVNFKEGQSVKAGEVLAQIDPRPYQSALEQARARKGQNDALFANAQRELARIRALVESEAEGKRLLEQQEATVAQIAAQMKGDDAAIAAAQLDLDFTAVRAPINGQTGVRMIDAGNLVTANQATGLVVIAQLQPISVIFSLPQQHLPALRRRMANDRTPLKVQALGEDNQVLAEGKLELVDNLVDVSTGTLKLKATFANDDFPLWPGQFVTARVLVEVRGQAVTVPREVVQPGLKGPFAYVIKSDKSVEVRQLKVGPSVDGVTIVEEGLKPGEQVVREGQNKLQPGAKVSLGEHAS